MLFTLKKVFKKKKNMQKRWYEACRPKIFIICRFTEDICQPLGQITATLESEEDLRLGNRMIFEQMVGPTKIELKSNSKRKARLNRCEKLMCYNKNKMYDS